MHQDAHRHGRRVHIHPHAGRHRHLRSGLRASSPIAQHTAHTHAAEPTQTADGAQSAARTRTDHVHDAHGHSHGLIDDSIKRSRDGVRAVALSLGVLGAAAIAQTLVFLASGSIALLADLIHNFGDALTAVPLGIAFMLRSALAERRAGLAVVAAIFISACVAGAAAIEHLVNPTAPTHLGVLALAGAIGYAGNFIAARIRTDAGRRLESPALVADGNHARADAYVSLAVVASAAVVALGAPIADPIIGLAITLVILRITLASWRTVRGERRAHHH
jgi:Co/Zn/Cd efflux system component